jgi:GntR family transcriptional regulator
MPSAQIPTIDELRVQYQVAEITLRQAIKTLASEGLLSSRRGKGTFVTDAPRHAEPTPVDTVIEQFSALDPTHRIQILARKKNVSAPLWDWRPGHAAATYVRVDKLHLDAAGEPYAVFQLHVESKLHAKLPPRADERDKIIRLVRDHGRVKIASARERMTIGIADFCETENLRCPAGLPVARIKRVFMDTAGLVLVYGAITYRGDRLVVERDFTDTANRTWQTTRENGMKTL